MNNWMNDPEAFSAEFEEFQKLVEELSREETEAAEVEKEG